MPPARAAPLLPVLLLAGACLAQDQVPTQQVGCLNPPAVTQDIAATGPPATTSQIASTIPWPATERAEYLLLDREDGQQRGRGVLSVHRRDGRLELRLCFESEDGSDESVVLVNAATLKPLSVLRELRSPNETVVIAGVYQPEEDIVEITERRADDERVVPLRLEGEYYDNDSSLFLWRSIPFQEDSRASYQAVLTNFRRQAEVTVQVIRVEQVTVPAGTFDAWRVEVRAGDVEQVAWYADTPERPLVQYDNSNLLFQLTALESD